MRVCAGAGTELKGSTALRLGEVLFSTSFKISLSWATIFTCKMQHKRGDGGEWVGGACVPEGGGGAGGGGRGGRKAGVEEWGASRR